MAKWLRFTRDYDDRPHPRQMVHYPAGTVKFVPDAVAERALERGSAVETEKPGTIRDAEFKG
jgi:hypothetical protein